MVVKKIMPKLIKIRIQKNLKNNFSEESNTQRVKEEKKKIK